MMSIRPAVPVIVAMMRLPAGAAESEHYRIEHHGATAAASGNVEAGAYQNHGITGETGGIAQAGQYATKAGFAGQIYRAVSLGISAPVLEIAENSTLQLGAKLVMDDATFLSLDASSVEWEAVGPIASISPKGLLTSGAVYGYHFAIVAARQADMRSALHLIVKNVGNDDFGLYAADGIDDAWQVRYFGENNPDGGPDRDPFGSGYDNLFKYMAGLDPLDSMSRFTLEPEYDAAQRRMKLTMGPCFASRTYQVEASDDLVTWQPVSLPAVVSGDPEKKSVVDIQADHPARFYRVNIAFRELLAKPDVSPSGK